MRAIGPYPMARSGVFFSSFIARERMRGRNAQWGDANANVCPGVGLSQDARHPWGYMCAGGGDWGGSKAEGKRVVDGVGLRWGGVMRDGMEVLVE